MFLFTLNILSTAYLSWSIRWRFQESLIQSTYGRLFLSYDLQDSGICTTQVLVRLGTILTLNSAWSLRIVACFLYDLLRSLHAFCTTFYFVRSFFGDCTTIVRPQYDFWSIIARSLNNVVRSQRVCIKRSTISYDPETPKWSGTINRTTLKDLRNSFVLDHHFAMIP